MKPHALTLLLMIPSLAVRAETPDCSRGRRLVANFCAHSGGQAEELCRAGNDLVKSACGSGSPSAPTAPVVPVPPVAPAPVWTVPQPAPEVPPAAPPAPPSRQEGRAFGELGPGSVLRLNKTLLMKDGSTDTFANGAGSKLCYLGAHSDRNTRYVPAGLELVVQSNRRVQHYSKHLAESFYNEAYWAEDVVVTATGAPGSVDYVACTGESVNNADGSLSEAELVSRERLPLLDGFLNGGEFSLQEFRPAPPTIEATPHVLEY